MNQASKYAAFLLSVAFWPGIAGAATSPRWAVAALGLFYLRLAPALFAAWCFVKLDFDAAVHWAILAALLSFGMSFKFDWHLEPLVKAFAVGVGVSSLLAVCQALGWSPVDQIIPPAGLFLNKNVMGETACLTIILAFRLEIWPYAALALPALVLSGCRSAWAAIAVATLWSAPWRLKLVALACCAAFLASHPSTASLSQRFDMWSAVVPSLDLWGNGSYLQTMPYGVETHLHNDWLQLVYELGVAGLIPLALVAAVPSAFGAAVVVLASFGFPLQMPATAALVAVVIGHDLRVRFVNQRVLLRARLARAEFQ